VRAIDHHTEQQADSPAKNSVAIGKRPSITSDAMIASMIASMIAATTAEFPN
jgi:hypothetical protein